MTSAAPFVPLHSDAALEAHLADLLGVALSPRAWLFLLDEEQRPVGTIVQIEGLPDDPSAHVEEHAEKLTDGRLLALRIDDLAASCGATDAVLVWERPGDAAIRPDMIAWARCLGPESTDLPTRMRAQFLLHDEGLRIIALDDLL